MAARTHSCANTAKWRSLTRANPDGYSAIFGRAMSGFSAIQSAWALSFESLDIPEDPLFCVSQSRKVFLKLGSAGKLLPDSYPPIGDTSTVLYLAARDACGKIGNQRFFMSHSGRLRKPEMSRPCH